MSKAIEVPFLSPVWMPGISAKSCCTHCAQRHSATAVSRPFLPQISPIFRHFSPVLSVLAPGSRTARKERRKRGAKRAENGGERVGWVALGYQVEDDRHTYPSQIGRRPALFFLGHISPIFAPFFLVLSRFSPSRRQDSRKWHQKTGGWFRNGPKRPPKEWSPPFFRGVSRTGLRSQSAAGSGG